MHSWTIKGDLFIFIIKDLDVYEGKEQDDVRNVNILKDWTGTGVADVVKNFQVYNKTKSTLFI